MNTKSQFEKVIAVCREIFEKKMFDYGPSWRIMRPQSVTDQIFIKAKRIRSLETKGEQKIDDGIRSEFIAIVNYSVIGLIQIELGYADAVDIDSATALQLFDRNITASEELMLDKNHDYDEAWRDMRISSYTDMILTKINRVKNIESNNGQTLASEGIDSNYMDMINYALFALIKLDYEQ
jgi:hypothetical protein